MNCYPQVGMLNHLLHSREAGKLGPCKYDVLDSAHCRRLSFEAGQQGRAPARARRRRHAGEVFRETQVESPVHRDTDLLLQARQFA